MFKPLRDLYATLHEYRHYIGVDGTVYLSLR